MKKFIIILITFFFITNVYSENKIAYIDLKKVFSESLVGKSINNQIKIVENNKKIEFEEKEKKIKSDEGNLLSKQNILSKDELDKLINDLKIRVNKYQNDRNEFNKKLSKQQVLYTNKILTILKPILSEYVKENKISLLLNKNIVVVGKKDLDITENIVQLLNKQIKDLEFKLE
tara:strand:- start:2551 stop:3072 length:522 start_codon:yes stop_codon:yes gene_type:complete